MAELGRIEAVPILLNVLCEMTGLRCAGVACTTENIWHACAAKDDLSLGIELGSPLQFIDDAGFDSHSLSSPIVIERGDADARFALHRTSGFIQTFVSVPIVLAQDRLFGALCAADSKAVSVSQPRILAMFSQFAALIANQLEQHAAREQEHAALLTERATSELRDQFIAVLGHDLRNPLHAVGASSALLERRLTDPSQRALASRIKTQTMRMSALIDDVLDFARGQLGGGIGLEVAEQIHINNGLITVIQELQDAQEGARIISDVDVNRAVRCDLGRLQQVASNLLSNALTHGKPNSPVKLSARTDEKDLILEVWNDGEPIPPESLTRIFEPFWRHSVAGGPQGLGLSLHICAQIVRAHAGRMSVWSTPEDGTQFTARFPLHDSAHDPANQDQLASVTAEKERRGTGLPAR